MIELTPEVKQNMWLIMGMLFLAWAISWWQLPDGKTHVYFLDVGQGDSIFVVSAENHQILIDGGPDDAVMEELAEVMPFFDRSIDLVVLTHPDADHLNGLLPVLKRFDVEAVLISGVMKKDAAYSEFFRLLKEREVNIYLAREDQDFGMGSVLMDVLYPLHNISGETVENVNDTSVSVMLHIAGKKVLLTGDLEVDGEKELIHAHLSKLRADVFKAGHHGSKTSSSPALLQLVRPDLLVVQSGKDNKFGHPVPEVLRNAYRAGVKSVRRNDLEGRIELTF